MDIQKGLQGRVHQKDLRRCPPSALTTEEILIELNRNRIEYGSKMGYQTARRQVQARCEMQQLLSVFLQVANCQMLERGSCRSGYVQMQLKWKTCKKNIKW